MKRIALLQAALALVALVTASLVSLRTIFSNPVRMVSRRTLVIGGLGLTALSTAAWRSRATATRLPSGALSSAGSCILTPEQTEGPYYIPREKVRANIAEHRLGTPLTLHLTVVNASTCTPLKGAAVDIWHCDASGIYSGFEQASAGAGPGGSGGPPGGNGNGGPPSGNADGPPAGNAGPTDKDTFLRGIQRTDAAGRVTFLTIYPGWYTGRTVHIHVKVHVGGAVVHTGQLFFPDTLTSKVYQAAPYRARAAARDTWNSTDSIYSSGGAQSMLTIARASQPNGGYRGTITLGVRHA